MGSMSGWYCRGETVFSCRHCRFSYAFSDSEALWCYWDKNQPAPCKDARVTHTGHCGFLGAHFEREPGADDA